MSTSPEQKPKGGEREEEPRVKRFAKFGASIAPTLASIKNKFTSPKVEKSPTSPTTLKPTTTSRLKEFFTDRKAQIGRKVQEIKKDYAELIPSNIQPQPIIQYPNWDGSRGQVPIPIHKPSKDSTTQIEPNTSSSTPPQQHKSNEGDAKNTSGGLPQDDSLAARVVTKETLSTPIAQPTETGLNSPKPKDSTDNVSKLKKGQEATHQRYLQQMNELYQQPGSQLQQKKLAQLNTEYKTFMDAYDKQISVLQPTTGPSIKEKIAQELKNPELFLTKTAIIQNETDKLVQEKTKNITSLFTIEDAKKKLDKCMSSDTDKSLFNLDIEINRLREEYAQWFELSQKGVSRYERDYKLDKEAHDRFEELLNYYDTLIEQIASNPDNNSTTIGSTAYQRAYNFVHNNGPQQGIDRLKKVTHISGDPKSILSKLEQEFEDIKIPYKSAFNNNPNNSRDETYTKASKDLAKILDEYDLLKRKLLIEIRNISSPSNQESPINTD
jgi:hypothetical protein